MKVLITGATGFVGKRLVRTLLRDGAEVVVLSRSITQAQRTFGTAVSCFAWDPMNQPAPANAFEGVTGVVHLAGEGVAAKRWSEAQKKKILDSRVLGTRHLVETLNSLSHAPLAVVFASAIGIYGNRGDEALDETSPEGTGFLTDVCRAWESESAKLKSSIRRVNARIGIILGREGGALQKLLPLFKLGLGGPVGKGNQYMSWIHVDDVVGLLIHGLKVENTKGAMNTVSPNPVTNKDFSKALGKALHRPAIFPAPALALKLAMGELSDLVLHSQKVAPRVALASGYEFKFPLLEGALVDIANSLPEGRSV